jgi:hypothetical protein
MYKNSLFDSLKEVVDEENKKKRKPPSYIYLDENTGQIRETSLLKLKDSAGAYKIRNPAKIIHDFMFGTISPNYSKVKAQSRSIDEN